MTTHWDQVDPAYAGQREHACQTCGNRHGGETLDGHDHEPDSCRVCRALVELGRESEKALAEEARLAMSDVACVHPGCGLPERLHGAPDGSRATHSSHWYCSRSDHPNHRHGPRAAIASLAASEQP